MTDSPGIAPVCPYCDKPAVLAKAGEVHAHRPDLADKPIWICWDCLAWVGCHPGGYRPLGRLADAELRQLKSMAHAAFDPLWRRKAQREGISRTKARRAGYAWLAEQMGMDAGGCHIGEMDVAQCERVIEICSAWRK